MTRTFASTSGVYALADPRTGRVMYVGQSIDIEYRYRQHCDPPSHDMNLAKRAWIDGLRREGIRPELRVLSECECPEIDEAERRFIQEYRSRGECELNIADGGASRGKARIKGAHKDDWFQFGRMVKRLRRDLDEVMSEAWRLSGRHGDEFRRVKAQLDRAKSRMEVALFRAFPDWEDESWMRCFYGADDAGPPEGEGAAR